MNSPHKFLRSIFAEHRGKVSDKWSVYVTEYERIFWPYRHRAIRLLEIGVQNGGSLEIWSKYFVNADMLLGCDVNSLCGELKFDDPRVAVIVADANSDEAQQPILALSPKFDVIIDDGSHRASDIVRSFARYFSCLNDDGIYIVEDIHCSYWREFEGGIFQPYSSIAFFKRLTDIVNYEHWGVSKARSEVLGGFIDKFGIELDETTLSQIHSIEFMNSMCVIKKARSEENTLGTRRVTGATALVDSAPLLHKGSGPIRLDQAANVWSTRVAPIEEELILKDQEIVGLKRQVTERDLQIAKIGQCMADGEEAYDRKLLEIQQMHEQRLSEEARRHLQDVQVYRVQMHELRQQIEIQRLELIEGEGAHSRKLLEMHHVYEQQKDEQSRQYIERERVLKELFCVYQTEACNLRQRYVAIRSAHALQISQLSSRLETMQSSYSWRWTAPLRNLGMRMMPVILGCCAYTRNLFR